MMRQFPLLAMISLAACASVAANPQPASAPASGTTQFTIDSTGRCIVIESSGSPELDRKSCDVARQCVAQGEGLKQSLERCATPANQTTKEGDTRASN